jgi:hypothetical protein
MANLLVLVKATRVVAAGIITSSARLVASADRTSFWAAHEFCNGFGMTTLGG